MIHGSLIRKNETHYNSMEVEKIQRDGKMLMSVKREIAITCEFCCDLHLTLRVFWSKEKIPLKESG